MSFRRAFTSTALAAVLALFAAPANAQALGCASTPDLPTPPTVAPAPTFA
jgi:hypothetical protein